MYCPHKSKTLSRVEVECIDSTASVDLPGHRLPKHVQASHAQRHACFVYIHHEPGSKVYPKQKEGRPCWETAPPFAESLLGRKRLSSLRTPSVASAFGQSLRSCGSCWTPGRSDPAHLTNSIVCTKLPASVSNRYRYVPLGNSFASKTTSCTPASRTPSTNTRTSRPSTS